MSVRARACCQATVATFTSLLPVTGNMQQSLARQPRIQVLTDDDRPLASHVVTVTVVAVTQAGKLSVDFDCSSDAQSLLTHTLMGARYADICRPVIEEPSARTSSIGLASFNMMLGSGPPGVWHLVFQSGLAVTTAAISVESEVFQMLVVSEPGVPSRPQFFTPGVPLTIQPRVMLFRKNRNGGPVMGRRVLAFGTFKSAVCP